MIVCEPSFQTRLFFQKHIYVYNILRDISRVNELRQEGQKGRGDIVKSNNTKLREEKMQLLIPKILK